MGRSAYFICIAYEISATHERARVVHVHAPHVSASVKTKENKKASASESALGWGTFFSATVLSNFLEVLFLSFL